MSGNGNQSHAGFGDPPPVDPAQQPAPINPETIPRIRGGQRRTGQGASSSSASASARNTNPGNVTGPPPGLPRPREYPPCDGCLARNRNCSQFRPCARCHTEGEPCTDSPATHAAGNLEKAGRAGKRKRVDVDDDGRPIKRVRLPELQGPCATCASAGLDAAACDADHRLRIECTPCADLRAIREPDHECAVADATYRPKRSQWTRHLYDHMPQVVQWTCEECLRTSNRGCDVDPRVVAGCSECAVRGLACRFVPDRREPEVVRTMGRRPVRTEYEIDPGPAWWRRRCGRCAALGLSCGWLSDYRNIGLKCSNCINEQREKRKKEPEAVVPCYDAEDEYTLCERELGDRRDDGSVVLPAKLKNRTPKCTSCRRGGARLRCRGYEGLDHLACVRCVAWGLPCFDKNMEHSRPSGDQEHPGVFPEPKPYGDLQQMGWGTGNKSLMEYPVCRPCQAGDYNCDRQRPCDKCLEYDTANDCTGVATVKDLPAGLIRRGVFTDTGVQPANAQYPPSFYMAMGFGPYGVDDVRTGPVPDIGVPGPQWGMWQVRVPDPDDPNSGASSLLENRKLVRRENRAPLYQRPADFTPPATRSHTPRSDPLSRGNKGKSAVEPEIGPQGPQGYPVTPGPDPEHQEDDNVVMHDAQLDFDNDLANNDYVDLMNTDFPAFEPPPIETEEDLDDAAITAELNSLFDPSSRFLKALLGPNALPPVDDPLDPLWLVSPPERVLLTLQFQDPDAVSRHPWAPADNPFARNDRAKHLLTRWQRPSASNLIAAIPDEPDVLAPDVNNPAPPCAEPTSDPEQQRCQTPCPDPGSVCASRHHIFHPDGVRPVCGACNARSVAAVLKGPERLTHDEVLSLRTYACSRCTAAETLAADRATTILNGAQHPLTGCLCGTKLFARPLCGAHRATLAARAVIHAALVREWRLVNFAPDQCVFCKFRAGPGHAEPAPVGPSVFHCSVCARVVQDDGATPTLFPGYEGWAKGPGKVFRANETAWRSEGVPIWGEDEQMGE